ncbi:MAG: lamin tail domain-containing protein, partial [Verrucomicrobiae bacterium]|nr:lamin tail domain-containing protein [Verrucomicrobiae bacterium]
MRFTSAVAPGASLYVPGRPVVLDRTVLVRARTLWGTNWSAVTEATFQVEEFGLPLRIVEIMYNPPGDEPYEFIELENISSVPIDISNVSLTGVTFRFPQGTILPGYGRLLLASDQNPQAFQSRYPGVTAFGYFKGSLSNSGEKLSILDHMGRVVHSVIYSDRNGWPTEADGKGYSLEIVDPFGDPNDPANWRASANPGGSPGMPSPPHPAHRVRLNEICVSPSGESQEGEPPAGWVEIYNSGDSQAYVGGWTLRNARSTKRFWFPPATISPKGYLLVWLAQEPKTGTLSTGFALEASGDSLFLDDEQGRRVDAVSFGQQLMGFSIGRIDEKASWELTKPTPAAPNQPAPVAPHAELVINELMANALPGESDWIELFNRSHELPVSLRGISFSTSNALFQVTSLAFCKPRGHILLFADENAGPDHVCFKLPAAGGSVALYDPMGNQLDKISYTNALEGVSIGRFPDGTQTIKAFPLTPSPGAPNYLPPAAGVRINELMAINTRTLTNTAGKCADWIELYNPDQTHVVLAGMRIRVGHAKPTEYQFPQGAVLSPNSYLVLWCDDAADPSKVPAGFLYCPLTLDDNGDTVSLLDTSGQLIDSVTYGFQIPDMSIGRVNSQWSLLATPTPGTKNSAPAQTGNPNLVRINEWMTTSKGNDWIELYNADQLPVDLGGLAITDDPSLAGQTKFVICPLTLIGGRGRVVYEADGDPALGPNHLPFKLDALGETIRLYSKTFGIIDEVNLLVQERGVSEGRLPDGSTNTVRFYLSSSPRQPNYIIHDKVTINEILPNPLPPFEGAVELHNLGNEPISLAGWWLSDDPLYPTKYRIPDS